MILHRVLLHYCDYCLTLCLHTAQMGLTQLTLTNVLPHTVHLVVILITHRNDFYFKLAVVGVVVLFGSCCWLIYAAVACHLIHYLDPDSPAPVLPHGLL